MRFPAWLLAAIVLLAPLPFGSARPLPEAILESAAFLVLALSLAWAAPRHAGAASAEARLAPGALVPVAALVTLAILGVAQALRLPAWAVRALSPASAAVHSRADAVLAAAGEKSGVAWTLSLAPDASKDAALMWAAIAALLLASALLSQDAAGRARRTFALALLAGALLQVFYGLANIGTGVIWGIEVAPEHASRLRGTFPNADHCALQLEMALATALAWVWYAYQQGRGAGQSTERRVLALLPPAAVWIVLFVGLAFTGSRAGLVAAVAAALLQAVVAASLERRWRTLIWAALLVVLGGSTVALLGLEQGFGRWLGTPAHDLSWNNRLIAARASFSLWREYPWLGTGLGTFRDAFPLVQPRELVRVWTHAHDDWLELLVTTGVVGTTVFALGLLALGGRIVRRLRPECGLAARAGALAALGALVAAGLHSWVDFGLTIPANAATLAVLCGAAVAASPVRATPTLQARPPAAAVSATEATADSMILIAK